MTLDFSEASKVKVTMSHFVQDILSTCEVSGAASTPASESLFESRDTVTSTESAIRSRAVYANKLVSNRKDNNRPGTKWQPTETGRTVPNPKSQSSKFFDVLDNGFRLG